MEVFNLWEKLNIFFKILYTLLGYFHIFKIDLEMRMNKFEFFPRVGRFGLQHKTSDTLSTQVFVQISILINTFPCKLNGEN